MEYTKPCIAILASPGLGHLIPVLELSKRLAAIHFVDVTLFVTTTTSSAAQSQLLQSSLPHGVHIVHLPPIIISTVTTSVQSIDIIIKESLPALRSELKLLKPTAIIVDIFGYLAFEIADEMKIPKYVLVTSTAYFLALTMYVSVLDHEIDGEYVHLQQPIHVPGCRPIHVDDVVDPMLDRKEETYSLYLDMSLAFRKATGLLLNTWEDLEPMSLTALREDAVLRTIMTPHLYTVGPLVRTVGPRDEFCSDWLQMQPKESVLYVSFGSGGTLSHEQLTELAWGLELSQQRFIWVVRKPEKESAEGTFFSVGSGQDDPSNYLPQGFLTRVGGVGIVVPEWAAQADILSHQSTGGFMSHCGWNSALESIINGVPMIAWPLYAEQRMNASMLAEDLGVAIRRSRKEVVRREEIDKMVRLLMEGEEGKAMRARMKDVQASALKAIDKDGSSYGALFELTEEWKSNPQL